MRKFLAVGLAAVLLLTLTGTAFAAKGGNKAGTGGGNANITITVPDGVFSGTSTALTSPSVWVKADCYQSGTLVYEDYELTDSTGSAVLPLGPTMMWTGGAASCTAQAGTINNGSFKAAASTTFNVSA